MTEHTPTPWHATRKSRYVSDINHNVIAEIAPLHAFEANAAFIAKAVNAHDRLIQALQFVVDGYDNQDVNHVDFRVRVYEVALDALASVAARRNVTEQPHD